MQEGMGMRIQTLLRKALYASAVAGFSWGSALAADLGGAPPLRTDSKPVASYNPWTFSFTTYGWLSWVKGDLTVRGRELEVDATPKQIIDALDWSGIPVWMSYSEARLGKLTLFNDIVYSKLAASGSFARSAQGRLASSTLSGSLQSSYTQAVLELGAAYEVWSNGSQNAAGVTAIDVLAGARYWYQEVEVSADLAGTLAAGGNIAGLTISGSRAIAKTGSVDWLDPVIGMRFRHQVAPGQKLTVRGDIGGFGVGSDFSWQAMATYDMRLLTAATHAVDAYLGYRALYVDYTKGSGDAKYQYDMLQHGPVMGLAVRF
jgi:hypothetical protein